MLDPFKTVIDDILRADLDAPRMQRHTAKRIYDRLIDDHGIRGVSYQLVRGYVSPSASRRFGPRWAAARSTCSFRRRTGRVRKPRSTSVRSWINLRGEPVTCMLLSLRLSLSGKAVHRIFASGGSEAFLEGHVHAFTTLGGVRPARSAMRT
ncbi:hypothetical protein AB0I61_24380 [Polymorphospora rubra]|uniref:hypothetical protein n=1 Tax=Polymorphospora rubra TaxID=338584 RepID=UPI0033E8FCDD